MENKKISFGFNKISKKTEIISKNSKPEKKVELIECLEGQNIKIKNAVEEKDEPLIIPMQGSSNRIVEEAKKAKEKRIRTEVKIEQSDQAKPDSELSIDELAARELIQEAKNRDVSKTESKIYFLSLNEDKFVADGAEEPSLDDYENVPISDYGMAMLRGMNWKEGMPIGKRTKLTEAPKLPDVRPKGLGLGANKMVNANKPEQSLDKDGKELQLVKGAFAKIIAGNHRGHYCEVQGFDDENCRIIVRTSLSNEILNLSEFLLVPVSKEEYVKASRVINNAKYEEYNEKKTVSNYNNDEKDSRTSRQRSRSHDRHRLPSRDRTLSKSKKQKKKSKKSKNKYSSDSEDERVRRRKHKKNKQRDSSNGDMDSEKLRRDKDRSESDSEKEYSRRKDKEKRYRRR